MTLDTLIEIQEEGGLTIRETQVIDLVIEALSDWPGEVKSLEDYCSNIICINGGQKLGDLSIDIIDNVLKNLDPYSQSWERESLSSFRKAAILSEGKIEWLQIKLQ